jgi:hypothetical protein
MKLNKTQVNALARRIYDEVCSDITEANNNLIKESVHTFLKTDVGKAVTKVNTSFFDIVPIPDYTIKNLAMKYYGHILYKVPRVVDIENDIIIESIASDDVTNLIQGITQKYSI